MTYKQALTREMTRISKDERVRFLGYNVLYGSRMYGTLDKVPANRCIEMPVAENLIVGVAMGLSLEGYLPIVCFERMDFMLCAADAIINHVDKMPRLSGGQFNFPIVFRCCVGNDKPLDPGEQHTSDYITLFDKYTSINIWTIRDKWDIKNGYGLVPGDMEHGPIMLVEYKEKYDTRD